MEKCAATHCNRDIEDITTGFENCTLLGNYVVITLKFSFTIGSNEKHLTAYLVKKSKRMETNFA